MKKEFTLITSQTPEEIFLNLKAVTRETGFFKSMVSGWGKQSQFKGIVEDDRFDIQRTVRSPVPVYGRYYADNGRSRIHITFEPGFLAYLQVGLISLVLLFVSLNGNTILPLIGILVGCFVFYSNFKWEVKICKELLAGILQATEEKA